MKGRFCVVAMLGSMKEKLKETRRWLKNRADKSTGIIMECAENMNRYYEEIQKVRGAEELRAIVEKWEKLASNLKGRSFGAPIVLPDIIMYTEHGFGNSEILGLLAEYLDSKKVLMDFAGDVKLFEFAMNYCPPEQPFSELARLMDSVRVVAGYRNEFKGVVRIALDQWVGHHSEKYFLELMEYLTAHTNDWLIVLTISTKSEEKAKKLEATASMFLRTEVVHMRLPGAEYLAEYAGDYIGQFGIALDTSAVDVLTKTIEKLCKIKHFHSYRTVEMLCNDIVYYVMSEAETPKIVLSAEDIIKFSEDSDYIKKTEIESAKRIALGFGAE